MPNASCVGRRCRHIQRKVIDCVATERMRYERQKNIIHHQVEPVFFFFLILFDSPGHRMMFTFRCRCLISLCLMSHMRLPAQSNAVPNRSSSRLSQAASMAAAKRKILTFTVATVTSHVLALILRRLNHSQYQLEFVTLTRPKVRFVLLIVHGISPNATEFIINWFVCRRFRFRFGYVEGIGDWWYENVIRNVNERYGQCLETWDAAQSWFRATFYLWNIEHPVSAMTSHQQNVFIVYVWVRHTTRPIRLIFQSIDL